MMSARRKSPQGCADHYHFSKNARKKESNIETKQCKQNNAITIHMDFCDIQKKCPVIQQRNFKISMHESSYACVNVHMHARMCESLVTECLCVYTV